MPFVGEIFSLLCAIVWASAIILFRVAGTRIPALEQNLVKNVIALGLLASTWGIMALIDPAAHGMHFSGTELLILTFSGLVGITLADTLLLSSLSYIGASRNAVISCLFSPFVIVLAVLFLGERVNLTQGGGFLLVLASTLMITLQKPEGNITPSDSRKGIWMGVLSVAFIAVGMTSTKYVISDASVLATATIRMAAGVLGSMLWIGVAGRHRTSLAILRGPLPWITIASSAFLGSYVALLFWIIGFQHTETSTASVLNQTSVLFTLVFAAIFLRESLNPRKVLGAILGFSGVAVLFLMADRSV